MSNDPIKEFDVECRKRLKDNVNDSEFVNISKEWLEKSFERKYMYNYRWMGRPIIQFPQDMIAVQELIWDIKPTKIIECGIAHGGSIIYYASLLELLSVSEGIDGEVIGIDIDIRKHNRQRIEVHPMFKRITLIEGSSIDPSIIKSVHDLVTPEDRVLVLLDSNHTHEHVIGELNAYASLVTPQSYCVVFDTIVEDLPKGSFPNRPWDKGDNPKTAVWEFLKTNPQFEIDEDIEAKTLITVAPSGFLKRTY